MTQQTEQWSGDFGKQYTDRNPIGAKQMDEYCIKTYGVSRQEMNAAFLQDIPKDARILEVGCNVGSQLDVLQKMGFVNLCGIELQEYAIQLAKKHMKDMDIMQGSIFNIPFKDNHFDLVFTSGVLIHIAPKDLRAAMLEMRRCTNKYIWGFEYYSQELEEINYRGRKNLLWKDDFVRLYLDACDDLELVRQQQYKYLDSDKVDSMFLIKVRGQ